MVSQSKIVPVLVVGLLISTVHGKVKFDGYKPLSKKRSLTEVFGKPKSGGKLYSFDTAVNLKYCKKHVITIPNDGRADYGPVINDGLQKLRKSYGGGTLKLKAGVYVHRSQIVIPSYCCLIGAGMGKTVLKLGNKSPPYRKSGSIRVVNSERITVMDLTQDGNDKNQNQDKASTYGKYGYFHELVNYVYMARVKIMNNHGYGFDPHGDKVEWSYYLVIEDCEATRNGLDGFTLDQSYYVSMLNSKSYNNFRHGYNLVTGLNIAVVSGNVASNNGFGDGTNGKGCGFMAQNNQNFGTNGIRFQSNVADTNKKAGFCVKDVYDVLYFDNKSKGTNPCFQLLEIRDTLLDSNTCDQKRVYKLSAGVNEGDEFVVVNAKNTAPTPTLRPPPPTDKSKFNCGKIGTSFTGISDGKSICCLGSCGKCGGSGCGKRYGGSANCCSSGVKAQKRTCSSSVGAPCIIKKTAVVSNGSKTPCGADGSGKFTGYGTSSVCCHKSCGSCGGSSCSKRVGGAGKCCTSSIKAEYKKSAQKLLCGAKDANGKKVVAPCVIKA